MRRLLCFFLSLACLLLTACGNDRVCVERLGAQSYTMKTLDGLFFMADDTLYLISGTEVTQGSESQVFIYDVDHDKVVTAQSLENSTSMAAFCETAEDIFFATISKGPGCDLYAWSKTGQSIRTCAHFEETGVYDLVWDGGSSLFIGTSYPANVYDYDINSGAVQTICTSSTEEPFIRSMSTGGGHLYLGTGTHAEFIDISLDSGAVRSILPARYADNSFIYSQETYGGEVYLHLTASGQIIRYSPESGSFTDTGVTYRENMISQYPAVPLPSDTAIDLQGDLVFLLDGTVVGSYSTDGGMACYLDTRNNALHFLTGSGIYTRYTEQGAFYRDFFEVLEPGAVAPTEFLAYGNVLYIPARRFLRYDLTSQEKSYFLVTDEPQASTVTEDGVYTANYTACTLYFYPFDTFDQNPAQVWMNDPEQFLLADIEDQCRPYQMEITPDGRYLVVGSGPLYGQFGGAVSVYDLEAGELLYTHPNVVRGHRIQSVKCSTEHPGAVWLGTSPYGENTKPQYLEEPSHLILWDIQREEILLDIVPDGKMKKLPSIAEREGRVYCVTQAAHLLSFDAASGEALAEKREDGIVEILSTSDGSLLGISTTAVYSIDPVTLRTKELAGGFTLLSHLTEDPVTGTIYVFDGTELVKLVGVLS